VTNVVIHGIPYFVIVYLGWQRSQGTNEATWRWRPLLIFVGAVWALAFVEELFWDRGVWNDRGDLFGEGWRIPNPGEILVPLLGVPQLTHYVLDGFIWKRAKNQAVSTTLKLPGSQSSAEVQAGLIS
jgi:hypothetical protein